MNLQDKVIGSLIVIGKGDDGRWETLCECGTISQFAEKRLITGRITSCSKLCDYTVDAVQGIKEEPKDEGRFINPLKIKPLHEGDDYVSLWLRDEITVKGIRCFLVICDDCGKYKIMPETMIRTYGTCPVCTGLSHSKRTKQLIEETGMKEYPKVNHHFKKGLCEAYGRLDNELTEEQMESMSTLSLQRHGG